MKKIGLKLLGILVILVLLFQGVALAANTSGLENEKNKNNDKIEDAKDKKEEITKEKNKTISEVEKLDDEISSYEAQIGDLNSKINDLNKQIEDATTKLNQKQADYTKNEELLEKRLVVMQESGETSYLDFILSSSSLPELISSFYLITEIANNDMELLEKIQTEKEEIEKAKLTLEESKKELDNTKTSKESMSNRLKTVKSEKDKKVSQLSESERKIQEEIDVLRKANASIDKKIQDAIREAEKNNAANNNAGGSSTGGGPTSSSGFIWPVPNAYKRITTGINYSSGQYHGAVDFGSAGINGQPIYAVADGQVIISERLQGSYGNYIIIMHYNGLFTLYAHGQDGSRTVSAGQKVKQGQQIMRVGNTGNSTGPHLHFEVRKSPGNYSNRVNPTGYLPKS